MVEQAPSQRVVNSTPGQICNECSTEIMVGDVCMATDGNARLKECLYCAQRTDDQKL